MSWLFGGKKQEPAAKEVDEYEREDFWNNVDIMQMSRKELRVALEDRNLDTRGGKKKLRERMQKALQEEKEDELAYLALVEAQRRSEKALEESGSVYAVGSNYQGQLGLGDTAPKDDFTCILQLRGKGVINVYAGVDTAFAVSEEKDVYGWGGGGTGPLATHVDKLPKAKMMKASGEVLTATEAMPVDPWLLPIYIETLRGEGILSMSSAVTHAAAVSDGGDLYTWGIGRHGQLGLGDLESHILPQLVDDLQEDKTVKQICLGHNHSLALLENGQLFSWGHAYRGKLGIGSEQRHGLSEKDKHNERCFPSPCCVVSLKIDVLQIACGPMHCIVRTHEGVYTWGSGDGGRLGHGDNSDRLIPTRVQALEGQVTLQVACGTWHSCCIVLVPPLLDAGWLFTWGSGYHGQLGLSSQTLATRPQLVTDLLDQNVVIWHISCGSHHNAALSDDNKLYTWGSNKDGCLGREVPLTIPFDSQPGVVNCFDAMVDRVGRGPICSVACGKEFTLVATMPYTGPSEEELIMMEREAELRKEEEDAEIERLRIEKEREDARRADEAKRNEKIAFLQSHPLCDLCVACPGFEPNVFKPNICKECDHLRSLHTGKRGASAGNATSRTLTTDRSGRGSTRR